MEQWLSVLFDIENARLWQPKNHGKPNLYETSVELIYKGETLDVHRLRLGVRTVKPESYDSKGSDNVGEFCFIVNGKCVFATVTNRVPLDALHSRDAERPDSALVPLDDLGCNAVRCRGGNGMHGNNMVEFAERPVAGFRRGFDYYFCKKLAYYYIKRSQQPICLMFDEPEGGHITRCMQ